MAVFVIFHTRATVKAGTFSGGSYGDSAYFHAICARVLGRAGFLPGGSDHLRLQEGPGIASAAAEYLSPS